MRIEGANGPPVPSPYRDAEFRDFLTQNEGRKAQLTQFERDVLAALATVQPERVLPRFHRRMSFCDRLASWFGD